LLDEVYSLGNKDGGDSFSKECIDTINQYLSEHVDEFICIIAGYKEQVRECFFSYNPGLERRFPWKFSVEQYTPEELFQISKLQLEESAWSWTIEDSFLLGLIQKNKDCFKGNGGDTKNLLDKCKISHARRIFTDINTDATCVKKRKKDTSKSPTSSPNYGFELNKVLDKSDIDAGFKAFIESKNKIKPDSTAYMNSMYI
jgi:hypothetical protein